MANSEIRRNAELHRYELAQDGEVALVSYNLTDTHLMITETLVPRELEGRGLAKRLAAYVIEDAQARHLQLLPVCPFFAGYLQKHPEHAALVHPTYRNILGI